MVRKVHTSWPVRTSNVDVSPAGAARLALTACLTAALLFALAAAGPIGDANAALKYKQPACGKFQKQVRNSTGAKKRSAKAQLKQCQANAAAYKQISIGDPSDPGTLMGPLIDEAAVENMMRGLDAVREHAEAVRATWPHQ